MNNKKVIIFHGTDGNPDVCWYRWLQEKLEGRQYDVTIPFYPQMNNEPIDTFIAKILSDHTIDNNTTLIGHSGGAALILSILDHIDEVIPQAILVAGYSTPPNEHVEPILQEQYNWESMRGRVRDIYFINSINDPYGCDEKQGRALFNHLGGTQIICNEGHFGDYNQPYPTFDLINKLVD